MSFDLRLAAHVALSPIARMRSIEERAGIAFFAFALLFAMTHGLFAHDYRAGEIEIDHPWSRAVPEGARVAGGYIRLVNHGSEPDRLVAATGEIAGRTEIHEMTINEQGVMMMRPIDGLVIPAGGEVSLEPGGYHIMFLDLTGTRAVGETFAGSLTFEKAGTVEVEFSVEAMGGHSHIHSHDEGDDDHGHSHGN